MTAERITHGRHCTCSACASEDWTQAHLAPCGMHGPSCPAEYQPWGGAGTWHGQHPPEQERIDYIKKALRLKDGYTVEGAERRLDALASEHQHLREENKRLYAELARLPNRLAAVAFGRVREGAK